MTKKESKSTSKMKRIEQSQKVHKLNFQLEEESVIKTFEDSISAVYGVPKVGKTKFAYELGKALQKKYSLPHSGTCFLKCDWVNYDWKVRGEMIPTWPTLREFVDGMEERPELVKTIKMFVIDTVDALVPMGMNTICYDLEVADLKDAAINIGNNIWSQEGWKQFRLELEFQLFRLKYLGPGVLILSHEQYEDVKVNGLMEQRAKMALSNSVYNTIVPACSMMLHMKLKNGEHSGGIRQLVGLESTEERAGDNLNKIAPRYTNGIIPFRTEAEAVEKLLGCFDKPVIKIKKKVKKAKKVKR